MKNILVICPTLRDLREIPRLGTNYNFIYAGTDPRESLDCFDPLEFIDRVLDQHRGKRIDAVIGTHDYPASLVSSIIAEKLGLSGIKVGANFSCQHKYYSRCIQSRLFGNHVPEFKLLDPYKKEKVPFKFPFFLKPVKSFFSIMACRIDSQDQFLDYMERSKQHLKKFVGPFNKMLKKYTNLSLDSNYILAETLGQGHQVTLEGYVFEGEVQFIGLTDSIMYKQTLSFKRFDYPSCLSDSVQQSMMDIAEIWLKHLDYGNGLFNIEFFYNSHNRSITIIEINPRMCPQFSDLVEKVDGVNTYRLQIDLSLGNKPEYVFNRCGKFRFASSFVLRKFSDMKVKNIPGQEEINQVLVKLKEARIEIYAIPGKNLSYTLQDPSSYRYGVINLGGYSHKDLHSKFDYCKKILNFDFQPV